MRQGVSLPDSSTASTLPPGWHDYEVRKVIDGLAGKRQAKQPPERRIVRRSRLLASLSAANARTILLIAPAGYGKTTLARQWLEETGGVWVTITEASGDIPVLARDLVVGAGERSQSSISRRIETALSSGRLAPSMQRGRRSRAMLAQSDEAARETDRDRRLPPPHGKSCRREAHWRPRAQRAVSLSHHLAGAALVGDLRGVASIWRRSSWALLTLALDEDEIAELLPPDQRTSALRRKRAVGLRCSVWRRMPGTGGGRSPREHSQPRFTITLPRNCSIALN